jgi:hypothetical protein
MTGTIGQLAGKLIIFGEQNSQLKFSITKDFKRISLKNLGDAAAPSLPHRDERTTIEVEARIGNVERVTDD